MARIEWVRLRLNNWALWKARETSGGLGWKTQAAYLTQVVDGGYRESAIPVDDVDGGVTDQAVESLKPTRPDLYETLHVVYVKAPTYVDAAPRSGQARLLGCSEGAVSDRLERADRLLSAWFTDRQERQAAQKKSFTTTTGML